VIFNKIILLNYSLENTVVFMQSAERRCQVDSFSAQALNFKKYLGQSGSQTAKSRILNLTIKNVLAPVIS